MPSDIVESYGRKQHKKSLRTKDHAEACRKLHGVVAGIKQKFEGYRATLIAQTVAAEVPKPTPTPQSFAELGRQRSRDIAEQALTIRADLYEEVAAASVVFYV
ncbi:DUF6538 domain-containing protein [Mesorhizobium sp. ZC-5]|uniref:DUF6538 domain-containing protein n=1 Tax=Mesorhizobium sp. ZC-5 TaxID=2986066 RepID=UPI0021E6EFF6|nr:DUF6538 domain-containing protein [Mesorhizobium sp. ZC-5]MCV3239296.1 hypothetical protein [Mesorhizobium sp. ZC-5]